MQLGRSLAEHAGDVEITVDQFVELVEFRVAGCRLKQRRQPRRSRRLLHRQGRDLLEEPAKLVDRVLPCRALVQDKAMKYGERGRLGVGPAILDGTHHRGGSLVAGLFRQVATDLEVGVDPFLDTAKDLEDE